MATITFNKEAGTQVFGSINLSAADAENTKAAELLAFIKKLGLVYKNIRIATKGQTVTIEGEVDTEADTEKIALAVGNVGGVETVNNLMRVTVSEPASQFYTVVSGDSLSKIAGKYYGDVKKYNTIFEANKPMLSDPDKIYPGQVLRIPAEK
ncbi:peptidoglycan-binding protein LysM [Flavobacterium zepuense]|uniref:Potassium binding protein Kbp n=1 Tax=Flavobacterium zepuense TaxID=2593302 RepID=A0A552V7D8_9FLAO|nr:peptidoglycan-binding protein LysM [Flavobacterium zepuense]TRW26377.1 peptidoglycan-binding protein LysM [Flavobacterium zepuense]